MSCGFRIADFCCNNWKEFLYCFSSEGRWELERTGAHQEGWFAYFKNQEYNLWNFDFSRSKLCKRWVVVVFRRVCHFCVSCVCQSRACPSMLLSHFMVVKTHFVGLWKWQPYRHLGVGILRHGYLWSFPSSYFFNSADPQASTSSLLRSISF